MILEDIFSKEKKGTQGEVQSSVTNIVKPMELLGFKNFYSQVYICVLKVMYNTCVQARALQSMQGHVSLWRGHEAAESQHRLCSLLKQWLWAHNSVKSEASPRTGCFRRTELCPKNHKYHKAVLMWVSTNRWKRKMIQIATNLSLSVHRNQLLQWVCVIFRSVTEDEPAQMGVRVTKCRQEKAFVAAHSGEAYFVIANLISSLLKWFYLCICFWLFESFNLLIIVQNQILGKALQAQCQTNAQQRFDHISITSV